MTDALAALLSAVRSSAAAPVLVLTGAGISAESGIPTFRGPEGYWRVGSVNYRPEEMATHESYEAMPEEVWRWYLMRRATCRRAEPNDAHRALVVLEQSLGDAFLLVTQNVDGLHARAGQSRARTYEIHGAIDLMRCDDERCAGALAPVRIPDEVGDDATSPLLCCATCGARARPHVLWFDESYDEPLFRFQSTQRAAATASLLIVVGTSGATTLPTLVVWTAVQRGIPIVVIDPDRTTFVEMAERSRHALHLVGGAVAHVPTLVDALSSPPRDP